MALKFFSVPVHRSEQAESELNGFLAAHRVLSVERRFVEAGEKSLWAVCIDYEPASGGPATHPVKKGRIDYRQVLPPEQFAVFVRLRELRSTIATKESIPVYTIFTNEQLAAMVQQNIREKTELESISGVGEARIKKYGDAFLDLLRAGDGELNHETDGKPV